MNKKYNIQSVIFDKLFFLPNESKKWLKKHNIKPIKKMHETAYFYRYRVKNPNYTKNRYYTLHVEPGIKFIISYRKNHP